METAEFRPIFAKFGSAVNKLYKGSYSSDNTPSSLKIREFFICNTDDSSGIGRHWMSVVKVSQNEIEIFNSLGADSEAKRLYEQIGLKLPNITKIHFNQTQVQSSSTATCGRFCIYFLIERTYNFDMDFDELLNDIFVESTEENEEKVATFFREMDLAQ